MKKKTVSLLFLMVFLIFTGCAADEPEQDISTKSIGAEAAIINGEPILLQNIQAAYAQQSTDIQNPYTKVQDENEILQNTIRELVVIQYGKKQGISLSEEENNNFINEFKQHMPDAYNQGIEAYGEKEYLNGLRMRQLFNLSKEWVMNSLEENITVSMDEVNQYMTENNVTGELNTEQAEIIKYQLKDKKLKEKYNSFVDDLIQQADIQIFI